MDEKKRYRHNNGFENEGKTLTMDINEMLHVMADSFRNKIDKDFSLIVQLDVEDKKASWHIVIENKKVIVRKGPHDEAHFILATNTNTLRQIYSGEITAMTAAAKAKSYDHAPLSWKLPDNVKPTPEIMAKFYFFIQHFFNWKVPEKIVLEEKHSRAVHGGHAIPLYYYPGFRSAWYLLRKGEKLNEPGDTDPFPQALIFIEGEGFAKIGNKTIKVKAGESYYIPPNSDHVVWTNSDKPLVFIWLAWGRELK